MGLMSFDNSDLLLRDNKEANASMPLADSNTTSLHTTHSSVVPLTTSRALSLDEDADVFNGTNFNSTQSQDSPSNYRTAGITHDSNDPISTSLNITTPTNGTITDQGATSDEDFKFNLFGTVIYPFRWLTLPTLYSAIGPISSLAMIIGCVLPYVPQYMTIYRNRNCTGFSTFVCLTLLLSNILRVAFWFGHRFELPLLIQSVIMIFTQILLLELCVRVKRQNSGARKPEKRTFFSLNPRYFWRWTDLMSYIEFLILLSALIATAMYFLIDCKPFVEAIGFCALVTESMLGLPQVIKNYRNKSVEGMSLSMVLMWLAGDTFKTGYFILRDAPFQFWLCGMTQITIDLLILSQVCLFRKGAEKSTRADHSLKEMGLK